MANLNLSQSHVIGGSGAAVSPSFGLRMPLLIQNEVGEWSEVLTDDIRQYWIQRASSFCQHKIGDFKESEVFDGSHHRFCTSTTFSIARCCAGERFERNWVCYYKSLAQVYCFICKLISNRMSKLTTGFYDWKHAYKALK